MVVPPKDFPGGASSATNLGTGTLTSAVLATDTSIGVTNASAGSSPFFSKTGPYDVVVEPGTSSEERITVGSGGTSGFSGGALLHLSRTSARSHPQGALVRLVEDKGDGTGTGMRARFIQAAADQLEHHWTDVKAASYFNSSRGAGILNQEWNFYTRLSQFESGGTAWVADPDSLKAFSDLAHRPYFGGARP